MEESNNDGSILKLPIFFWITVSVAILLLLIFILNLGITVWFLMLLSAWVWFIFFTKKTINVGSFVLQKSIFILIGLIVVTFIFMKLGGNNDSSVSNDINVKDNSNSSSYLQEESYGGSLSAMFNMGSELGRVDGDQKRALNYSITTFVQLYPSENIVGARYKNIILKKMPTGEVTVSLPTGEYSEAFINDGSHVIEIPVMKTEEEAMYANQIFGNFASLSLEIEAVNAFQFDVNEAYKNSDHGLWASDGVKAAKISPVDLDNVLEFDIEVELESGKKITKHFTGNISGSDFLEGEENSGGLSDVNLEVK